MKVYRLQQEVYDGVMDYVHSSSRTQDLLYFPGLGIMGYGEEKIDFFSDDIEVLERVQAVVDGKNDESKYLGEIDLPSDLVMEVVAKGKESNKTKASFEQNAKTLVDLVE